MAFMQCLLRLPAAMPLLAVMGDSCRQGQCIFWAFGSTFGGRQVDEGDDADVQHRQEGRPEERVHVRPAVNGDQGTVLGQHCTAQHCSITEMHRSKRCKGTIDAAAFQDVSGTALEGSLCGNPMPLFDLALNLAL